MSKLMPVNLILMKYRAIYHACRTVLLLCCDVHRKRWRRTSSSWVWVPIENTEQIACTSRIWRGTRHLGCCPDHNLPRHGCLLLCNFCRITSRSRRTPKIFKYTMIVFLYGNGTVRMSPCHGNWKHNGKEWERCFTWKFPSGELPEIERF